MKWNLIFHSLWNFTIRLHQGSEDLLLLQLLQIGRFE